MLKKFKINDFITLKLENGKTNIYVKEKIFIQCKHLLLTNPYERIKDEIVSIDEIAEKLNNKLEKEINPQDLGLTPMQEFIGHCSNLQAWVENNYDTKLLHRSISFPLLKKLSDLGDSQALQIFKKEISIRFKKGNETIRLFLLEDGYLNYLSDEDFESFFIEDEIKAIKKMEFLIESPMTIDVSMDSESRSFFICDLNAKRCEIIGICIKGYNLAKLPDFFKDLKNLKYVILEDNKIKTLSSSIGALDHLKILSLKSNKLKEIPSTVENLSSLSFLDLSYNYLEKLPKSLFNLENIKLINLNNNKLKKLTGKLGPSLETLMIRGNPLCEGELYKIKKEGKKNKKFILNGELIN